VPWPVLAAIGKVESDHGRTRLPGVRSGSNWAGACGPMQIGCVPGSKAGNSWARYGHGRPHDPADAIPAAARYLVDHGARGDLDRAIFAYNHSRAYVAKVKQLARRYARGGGGR
jgi:peptidoglycan DL-endopeptidase CwlO